jgi:CrcB protein
MLVNALLVGLGGFVGACARYALTEALGQFCPLPLGTLLSNVLAGFLIGLIIGFERQHPFMQGGLHLVLVTGLLGALSTFSAFSMETFSFIEECHYLKAVSNTLLNVGGSVGFVFVGLLITRG